MRKQVQVILLMLLLTIPLGAFAQQQMIKGQVTDATGETVIGATVMVKGSKDGSITDLDGKFAVKGKVGDVISITFIGYAPLEIKVTKLEGNQFVMKEDSKVLDEVVVVGMGTQKRNTITAAVSVVKQEAIASRPVTDVTSVLQGNVAGLTFNTDAASGGVGGEIGAEIKFNIRGVGSINGGSPYILVDGVEQTLQNVNPADIESMSVLKDASASAVYGARAAYGVVLVTTKNGKQGKARVSYNGTYGFSAPINMPEMMNSVEYANYENQKRRNNGVKDLFTPEIIDKMGQFMQNPYSPEFPGMGMTPDGTGWAGAVDNQYANTDWFDYYFKSTSPRQSHNLSVTGGTEALNFYVGMGYTYQGGLLSKLEDSLSKYNLNTKVGLRVNKWLKFDFNNNATLSITKRPMPNQTIFYNGIAGTTPNRPTQLPIDSEYNLPGWNEFLYLSSANYRESKISDAVSLSATITPLPDWDIIGGIKARLDVRTNDFTLKKPRNMNPGNVMNIVTGTRQGYQYPGMSWKNTNFGSFTRGSAFDYYLSPNVMTSYKKQLGDHFFSGMAGFQMEMQEFSNEFIYRDGMLSEDTYSFENSNGATFVGEGRTHWSTMGLFAKLNYNYKEIYFVEVSGRYDGSSRFAPGNRWGMFPSMSAGYDIARTDYFKDLDLPISQLKIRGSYGRLGNQSGAGLYDYLGIMPLNSNNANGWLLPTVGGGAAAIGTTAGTPKMISPTVTWEKVDNANLGLDLMLLNDRLSVTAEVYQRTTNDMIGPAEAIPMMSGIASGDRAKVNNASLRTRGWELTFNWQDRLKCGFSYGVGFNISNYQTIVTKYNNPTGVLYNNHTGLGRNKGYYEGMDLGEIWGYQADDLFMSNREIDDYLKTVDLSFFKGADLWQRGDVKYLDVNGDHKVDAGKGTLDDHGDLRVIGNATPKYSFGINLNVGYKGFEISTLLQGVGKRDFALPGSSYLFGGSNYFKQHLDYFSAENPDAYLPRLGGMNSLDTPVNIGYNTTRYLLNTAYMRMKNLMVSYTFEKKLMRSIGISDLRVYFTCDNLFTISKLPKQFDPETLNQVNDWAGGSNNLAPGMTSALGNNGNGKVYPMNRNFVFGIDFTF